ncbi:MAG: DEAD/DEAH box helicase [Bacteroidota bacterium]|nr:DEAD/DEAH box helicase [Bacteroidota bacterium]
MKFSDMGLHPRVLDALIPLGYEQPTPIQEQAIPHVLNGRDVMGIAQTGTGKTAAFSLPLVHHLAHNMMHGRAVPRVLVLTPTRELAAQIDDNIKAYAKNVKVRTALIFGGVSQHKQVAQIRKGADVLVATPGRLLDLCNQGLLSLEWIEFLVLDEADTMLDMGFIHDIRRVIAMLPEKRQSLFFSATMPDSIVKLSKTILSDPIRVEVARVSSAAETVDQRMVFVSQGAKRDLLVEILNRPEVETALVFTRTKYGADKVVRYLKKNNIRGEAIHGNKSQPQREKAMNAFRKGNIRVLVATDIAARGIDVEGVSHVINFEIPNISETYVHRIGRTGRAGREGVAISMVNEGDERNHMRDIVRLIKRDIPLETDHQWHLDLPPIKADSKTHKVPKEGDNKAEANNQRRPKGRGNQRRRGNQTSNSQRRQQSSHSTQPRRKDSGESRSQDGGSAQARSGGNRRWKKRPKFKGPKPQGDRS